MKTRKIRERLPLDRALRLQSRTSMAIFCRIQPTFKQGQITLAILIIAFSFNFPHLDGNRFD
jgi:hypothetical protein